MEEYDQMHPEISNLLQIIDMKQLYLYKGGLCVRYKDVNTGFRSVRVEHDSLREFVWAYTSKPSTADGVASVLELKLLVRGLKDKFKNHESVLVSNDFLQLLKLETDRFYTKAQLRTALKQYIKTDCAREVRILNGKCYDIISVAEVTPNAELVPFLPPNLALPFRISKIGEIVTHQVTASRATRGKQGKSLLIK